MPTYIAAQTIRDAVDRLGVAAVQSSLADFLIFKRALRNAKLDATATGAVAPNQVETGTKSVPFVRAIEEFALRAPRGSFDPKMEPNPYFLPFAAKRDDTLGYRTLKYPSNGSSDTVSRWQSRSGKPLVLVADTSPKAFAFETRSADELEAFFGVRGAQENFSGHKPLLLDTAIWWYRFVDLDEGFGGQAPPEELSRALIVDLDLSHAELKGLFM